MVILQRGFKACSCLSLAQLSNASNLKNNLYMNKAQKLQDHCLQKTDFALLFSLEQMILKARVCAFEELKIFWLVNYLMRLLGGAKSLIPFWYLIT